MIRRKASRYEIEGERLMALRNEFAQYVKEIPGIVSVALEFSKNSPIPVVLIDEQYAGGAPEYYQGYKIVIRRNEIGDVHNLSY